MNSNSIVRPNVAAAVGLFFLAAPGYFIVASVMRLDAPGLSMVGIPVILLGALMVAFVLNTLSVFSVALRRDTPPSITVSLSLRLWNWAVIGMALMLLGALLGYLFVENFQARPAS